MLTTLLLTPLLLEGAGIAHAGAENAALVNRGIRLRQLEESSPQLYLLLRLSLSGGPRLTMDRTTLLCCTNAR